MSKTVAVLTLLLLAGIFMTLGRNGIYGALVASIVFQAGYRCKHGSWFDHE